MAREKYALHPGIVISRNDGQRRRIGGAQLGRLYRLRTHEYIIWTCGFQEVDKLGRRWDDYIHLYPRYDGNYRRPSDQG
jgi:hypothetical protein